MCVCVWCMQMCCVHVSEGICISSCVFICVCVCVCVWSEGGEVAYGYKVFGRGVYMYIFM